MFQRNFNRLSHSQAAEWCHGIGGELPSPRNSVELTALTKLGSTWLRYSELAYQGANARYSHFSYGYRQTGSNNSVYARNGYMYHYTSSGVESTCILDDGDGKHFG